MQSAVNLWPLLGVVVIVVGFVLRANPVLVAVAACGVTGVAAAMSVMTLLETLGVDFNEKQQRDAFLARAAKLVLHED